MDWDSILTALSSDQNILKLIYKHNNEFCMTID